MTANTHHEIIGIQAARYGAALVVLVDHYLIFMCEQGTLAQGWLPFAYRLGALGVCIFFGISGFVMVLSNRNKFQRPSSAADFLVRRVIRIWPMYFLATMIVFALKHADTANTLENLMKSLVFVPYVGAGELYRPILGKGWTLNYEMFFYCVFALCLCFPKKAGLLLTALILLGLGASDGSGGGILWTFYADRIVLFFLVGVGVGAMITERAIRWPHLRSAAAAGLLATVVFGALIHAVGLSAVRPLNTALALCGVFACLYLLCFADTTFRHPRMNAIVARLGDASYCLYLFHGFVLAAFKPILQRLSAGQQIALLPIVCIVVTGFCVLLHLTVEKPLNRAIVTAYKNFMLRIGRSVLPPSPGT